MKKKAHPTTSPAKSTKKVTPIAKRLDETNVYTLLVDMGTPIIYTFISADVITGAPGWSGSGGSWGFGLAGGETGAVLTIESDSWADFASATTNCAIVDGGDELGGGLLEFKDSNGGTIGTAVLAGEVLGAAIGFSGDFSWR